MIWGFDELALIIVSYVTKVMGTRNAENQRQLDVRLGYGEGFKRIRKSEAAGYGEDDRKECGEDYTKQRWANVAIRVRVRLNLKAAGQRGNPYRHSFIIVATV